MECKIYPLNSLKAYKFVVILSRYRGQILLSKHRLRATWESQGGHIEPGETPLEAAKRELYEESGALEYRITPAFDYRAWDEASAANGMVFLAEIDTLGPLPESEMERTACFDALPPNLTYPGIAPVLFRRAGLV